MGLVADYLAARGGGSERGMSIKSIIAIVALLIVAVSPLSAVGAAAQDMSTVHASGEGTFFTSFGGEKRIFAFNAHNVGDEVKGHAMVFSKVSGAKVHVDVDCIIVIDPETVQIGGVITKSNAGTVGVYVVFAARDGGPGQQDYLSPLFEDTCESVRPMGSLLAIDVGNINVKVDEE